MVNYRRGFRRIGILITVIAVLDCALMLTSRGFGREVVSDLMVYGVLPAAGYWLLYWLVPWLIGGFRAKN